MVSGTQDDPKQAPIEGVVLTEAEVEEFVAECLESNQEKQDAKATENSEVSQGQDEEKEANELFHQLWQREKELALRMEAEKIKAHGKEVGTELIQEVYNEDEEKKTPAVPRREVENTSGEWSEEEGEKFEDASEGMLTSPPRRRGEQTAVFDVEATDRVQGVEDVVMQEGVEAGKGDLERIGGKADEQASSARRARFTEEFDEHHEEQRKANQRKPLRKVAARYDFKLILPPTEPAYALDALKGVLSEAWSILKEADKKMVIYPWNNESRKLPGLTKVEELPDSLSEIQEYFNRAFPRKQGGALYVSVFLGHEQSFADMSRNFGWWFKGQGGGWYLKALQCEKSSVIGWLLYSTQEMDRELLAQEIFRRTKVRVGLRFRAISVSARGQLRDEQLVRAIHVEIDDRNYYGDRARVEDLYQATREEGFPLGIKLRLCPQIQDAADPTSLTKLERLRLRQAAFLANVYSTVSRDIGVLDYEDSKMMNNSLRDLIMSIQDDEGVNVFISVDRQLSGSGVNFQYTSRYASAAQARIKGLIPYLKAQVDPMYREQLLKCFTVDAVVKAASYDWDPVRQCVVSAADKRVDDLLDCWDLDEEFEFADTDISKFELDISVFKKAQNNATANDVFGTNRKGVNPHDEDSVSTMVERHSESKLGEVKKGRSKANSSEIGKAKQKIIKKAANQEVTEEEEVDKAAVAAAITGEIRELQMKLARALKVPIPSPQPGQAGGTEAHGVGDGDVSGGRFA